MTLEQRPERASQVPEEESQAEGLASADPQARARADWVCLKKSGIQRRKEEVGGDAGGLARSRGAL